MTISQLRPSGGLSGTKPSRSAFAASRAALRGLILRDLVVLRKHFGEFVVRTLVQPFLLCFVFLYVFPKIGQRVGGGAGSTSFATVLVPGVVGISIMFQGVQSVALQLSTEFGYTRESRIGCRRPARSGWWRSRKCSQARCRA